MHYKRDASEIMYINGKLLRKPIISQTPESEEIEIRYNKANFFQKFNFYSHNYIKYSFPDSPYLFQVAPWQESRECR